MFDVLYIFVPRLAAPLHVEVRRRKSAFGLSDEEFLYFAGTKLAAVVSSGGLQNCAAIRAHYSVLANWTILQAATVANEAAANDEKWSAFLASLVEFLGAHPSWRTICESDCDQHRMAQAKLSPGEFGRLLDSHRTNRLPVAVEARPAEE